MHFSQPRQHIFVIFCMCLAVLAGMAFFNYRVDPAALFLATPIEDEIASAVARHQPVWLNGNINERQYERRRLAAEASRPEYLVIGSSRIMPVGEWLLGKQTVNAGVPGATLEDMIALSAMSAHLRPNTYVFGVDPWIFNRNNNQRSWHLIQEEYLKGLSMLGLDRETGVPEGHQGLKKLIQLINFEYFRESVKQLKRGKELVRFETRIPDPEPAHGGLIRADGSRQMIGLGSDRHEKAKIREASLANHPDSERLFGLNDFVAVDPKNLQKFTRLISILKKNSGVVIILSPYHPDAWLKVKTILPVVDAESQIRKLAETLSIPVLGSYSPETSGCGRGDFADMIHPHELCFEKIWATRQ